MKYTCEIEIAQPRDRVVELFRDPGNAKHWQKGLAGREQLEGRPGEVGSKARVKFVMGKRTMEMVEVVTLVKLPDEMAGGYESKMGFNGLHHRFTPIGETKTRLVTENEFRFNSGFMKVLAAVMTGLFKKQTMGIMRDFKNFAETGSSVASPA